MKLNLQFKDRVGIVADVSAVFARVGYNILAMEVAKTADLADVYFEVEPSATGRSPDEVLNLLHGIPDLQSLKYIDALPRERRERVLGIVLDNVSDGVLSVDLDGRITTINQVGKEMLNCEGRDVEGKKLTHLPSADPAILNCLKGGTFTNEKRNIITDKRRLRFFATGKPIIGSGGRVVGAVEIMKDMKEIHNLVREVSEPRQITFSEIIGKSPAIREVITFAQKIARTDTILSIRGESGTGKELLARAIHAESGREGPFIPINCAALPVSLLESELFGYVGGAFTGAQKGGAPGLFEMAQGGTLLLDEIADLPQGPQAKLLRVIQEKTVRRIGGKTEIPVNTRIITATNRHLEHMVREKTFRQDLYYRINVLPIHIPPLKERREDIPVLAEHFLFQLATKLNQALPRLSPRAMHKLSRHRWPGNVRELKNVVERAAILSDREVIEEEFILFSPDMGASDPEARTAASPAGAPLSRQMGEFEARIVARAVREARSIRQAAVGLGISHTALLNKLKKYKIVVER